jgi:hypothetical protein
MAVIASRIDRPACGHAEALGHGLGQAGILRERLAHARGWRAHTSNATGGVASGWRANASTSSATTPVPFSSCRRWPLGAVRQRGAGCGHRHRPLHGGFGYIREAAIEPMVRDARVEVIGGAATEVTLQEVVKRI